MDKTRTAKVLLSTGGPADWFELKFDETSHELLSVDYVYQDWGDGARRTLDADEARLVVDMYGDWNMHWAE